MASLARSTACHSGAGICSISSGEFARAIQSLISTCCSGVSRSRFSISSMVFIGCRSVALVREICGRYVGDMRERCGRCVGGMWARCGKEDARALSAVRGRQSLQQGIACAQAGIGLLGLLILDQRGEHQPALVLGGPRSEEHTSELQSQSNLVCRLLLEKKKKTTT